MLRASGFGPKSARGRSVLALMTATGVVFLGSGAAASAATTLTVNSTTDAPLSSPASTSCPSTCTLREAVQAADNLGGAVTIDVPAGTYTLSLPDTGTGQADDPAVGDLDINLGATVTIAGAAASSTVINANHIDRAFAVQTGGNLSISGVTIEGGSQPNTTPSSHSAGPGYGGAIYNDGVLSVSSSVLSGNSADAGGGAIFADALATSTSITNSTVTSNASDDVGGAIDLTSGTLTLSGDTISHSSADDEGGAIYDDETSNTVGALSITGSTISNNVADEEGGSVYVDEAGTLSITNSTLDSNGTDDEEGGAIWDEESGAITIAGSTLSADSSGDSEGGALYADDTGRSTISGSTFDNDSAGGDEGGAVYIDDADLTLSSSTFDSDASEEGSGVYIDGSSTTALESITTSTFDNDIATDSEGGGVYDDEGNLSITRSTFSGDEASDEGGAFYYDSADALTLANDTFDGNQATEGGAIDLSEVATTGTITLLNDTITRNTGYEGGGIYDPEHANTIENTIVAGNSGGITTDGGGDCYGTAATDNAASADIGGNIDSDGTCFSSSVSHDQTGAAADLGALADNGGPTDTDAPASGSPAVGDAISAACPSTDQRGVTRPSGSCDVGAYQTAAADLGIAATGPGTATVGTPVTYTLTVTNNGPGAATGVSVADTLPSNVTYFGSTSTQGSCSGTTTITCSLGALDSSETGTTTTASITITVIANTAGAATDKATVSATTTDPTSTNNSASATTQVSALAVSQVTKYLTPLAATGVASKISSSTARLAGLVNPGGESTTYTFQLRRKGTKGWRTVKGRGLSAGTAVDKVGFTVRRMRSATKYFFRIRAISSVGTSYGQQVRYATQKKKKAKKKK